MKKPYPIWVKILAVGVIALTICVGSFALLSAILANTLLSPPEGFCSQTDEVYTKITQELDTWIETFKTRGKTSDASSSIQFVTGSGKKYDAVALWDIWQPISPTEIQIAVPVTSWPGQGYLGAVGYLYSPSGKTDIVANDKVTFTPFTKDFFCYTTSR